MGNNFPLLREPDLPLPESGSNRSADSTVSTAIAKFAVLACADNLDFMGQLPDEGMKLIVTSPPYNIGKSYETKRPLEDYLDGQEQVISECVRLLHPQGSICWQVGNGVQSGEIIPLDAVLYPVFRRLGLKLRNRIVWHFGHGLHCSKRLSGRYETINWWTKGDDYTWNLDPIRVPSKYPQKRYFKGPQQGEVLRQSEGQESDRCLGVSECQEQSPGEDGAPVPVSG